VIILVGPSGSGKTHFSKNYLIPKLKEVYQNIQYISSDDLRRELLGNPDLDKNDQQMMAVSEQAFELLYTKLKLATSYPVNAEFVIVDTTGLNLGFRHKVTTLAKDANYHTCCIPFLYKDRKEYYKYIENPNRVVITAQINRFNRTALAEMRKKDFDSYFYIKSKDFEDIEIQVEDAEAYKSHFLPTHLEYPIIGDVHGCYDELLELLDRLNFKVENGKIVDKPSHKVPILAGDWIDGGDLDGIEKTINFLYENQEHFKLVVGNHEHFVYRYHTKSLDPKQYPPQVIIDSYFPTTKLLEQKPDVAEKFCALKEMAKDFYIGPNFIVTHAPCEERHLGKQLSLREQRNFRYPHKNEEESLAEFTHRYEDSLSFIKDKAAPNKPFHFFGHCRVIKPIRFKNKIGLDTGCVQGNRLTAAAVVGSQVFYEVVMSKKERTEELPDLFSHKKDAATEILPDVDISELDHKDLNRIRWAVKNKVNYISGTMSPADKDIDRCELETVASALNYFKSMGVTKLCLQPKYMGSRAELMLNCTDVSQSYTSTRRGHVIDSDYVDLSEAYSKILPKIKLLADEYGFEWVYVDCELMPWYALGEGLINQQYAPVKVGIESEIKLLKETGFEDQLKALIEEYEASDYAKLRSQLSKSELKKQITSHKCAVYEAIHHFQWIPLEQQEEYFSVYKRQLELFATQGVIHFKPFSILKGIHPDGSEKLFFDMCNSVQFGLVSEDECMVIDLDDDNALTEAEGFFNKVVEMELEGVVIKPEEPSIKDVAPYLKVRNPRYLSIIYGMDYLYPPKYEKLVRQKRINRKLQTSITEFEYGKRLLEIPRNEISMDNQEYINLFAKLLIEQKKEERFDPRL